MVNKPLAGQAKTWPLDSGNWSLASPELGFKLDRTTQGQPVSTLVTAVDLAVLLQTKVNPDAPQAVYPPEFRYCAATGRELQRRPGTPEAACWVPPFGSAPAATLASGTVRGLRQSSRALKLTEPRKGKVDAGIEPPRRSAEDDPDASLGVPPSGTYEFFSIPAGSHVPVLLALSLKGVLYALLPASRTWAVMQKAGGGGLEESGLAASGWRCEVAVDGLRSLIVVATKAGLTCLRPDAISLSFTVTYTGGVPAIGAPLQFDGLIWAPLRQPDGGLSFVSVTIDGEAANDHVDVPAAALGTREVGALQLPLANNNTAIWPCESGQLLLRKPANGPMEASFKPWPAALEPRFQFGSAYLSEGRLWQLCFDTAGDRYCYVQLGLEASEPPRESSPRTCSGRFNFRFATKSRNVPWEPEDGADANNNEVVLPVLELADEQSVLGLKMNAIHGLEAVLSSSESVKAMLVLDDRNTQTVFHTITVCEPARTRFFIHDRVLWAYHPALPRLSGWSLQP